MAQHTPATSRAGTFGAILRVTSGNFLEQFDFSCSDFTPPISPERFSGGKRICLINVDLCRLWLRFLMRPVGAIVLAPILTESDVVKG